jgi:hypothetical protein
MAIGNDLFLAILAMDAYNRAYNQGVNLGSNGSEVATPRCYVTAATPKVPHAFHFSQAYSWNGQTIISYRGTDQPLSDINNGYATGGGLVLDPARPLRAATRHGA